MEQLRLIFVAVLLYVRIFAFVWCIIDLPPCPSGTSPIEGNYLDIKNAVHVTFEFITLLHFGFS